MVLFPVSVTLPDGTKHATCKAMSTAEGGVNVYRWEKGPVLVAASDLPTRTSGLRSWELRTDEGIVRITQGSGCGCGHPLKHWKPVSPARDYVT